MNNDETAEMPGVPLRSGFEGGRTVSVSLPDEARRRVLAKMRSVDDARARAEQASYTAVIA